MCFQTSAYNGNMGHKNSAGILKVSETALFIQLKCVLTSKYAETITCKFENLYD